jgi:hypothetical protein
MIQTPTMNAPSTQVRMPRPNISTSGAENSPIRKKARKASQKVRSCQLKCDSSQVPRASSRFT